MQNVLNKFIGSVICLAIIVSGLCLSTSIQAFAFQVDHENNQTNPHESHTKAPDSQQHDHDEKNLYCCSDNSEDNEVTTYTNTKIKIPSVVVSYSDPSWNQIDIFPIKLSNNYTKANSPPDNSKRKESERDSSRLLI